MTTHLPGIVRTVQIDLNEKAQTVALIFHCHPGYGCLELFDHLVLQAKNKHLKIELVGVGDYRDERKDGGG
jgi:proteasome lid subunit RPN8/RPN11